MVFEKPIYFSLSWKHLRPWSWHVLIPVWDMGEDSLSPYYKLDTLPGVALQGGREAQAMLSLEAPPGDVVDLVCGWLHRRCLVPYSQGPGGRLCCSLKRGCGGTDLVRQQ